MGRRSRSRGRATVGRALLAALIGAIGCDADRRDPTMMGDAGDGGRGDTADAPGADAGALLVDSWAGINFPPTQGTTNAGAFLPGVYAWDYTEEQIAAASATFQAMRLPINIETAGDPAALATAALAPLVDRLLHRQEP